MNSLALYRIECALIEIYQKEFSQSLIGSMFVLDVVDVSNLYQKVFQ